MSDLFMEHLLQDMWTELKAMSRQLDRMDKDIQLIKRQLAEQEKHICDCKCNESAGKSDLVERKQGEL